MGNCKIKFESEAEADLEKVSAMLERHQKTVAKMYEDFGLTSAVKPLDPCELVLAGAAGRYSGVDQGGALGLGIERRDVSSKFVSVIFQLTPSKLSSDNNGGLQFSGVAQSEAGLWQRNAASAQAYFKNAEFNATGLVLTVDEASQRYFFGVSVVKWLAEKDGTFAGLSKMLEVVRARTHGSCSEALDASFGKPDTWSVPFKEFLEKN